MSQPHEFTVLDSELVLEAPIIAVRRDLLAMPGGTHAHREVVEHFGAVAIVAVDHDERVAMVEQYRHSVGRRLLEVPAGLLDIKNEDALVAAKRELWEEVGLAAEEWSVLADIVTSPGFCEEACRIYLARGLAQVERPEPADDEEADMDFAWIDLDEAVGRVLAGEVNNSIAATGVLAAHHVLRGGRTPRSVDAAFELRPTSLASRRRGPDMKKQ